MPRRYPKIPLDQLNRLVVTVDQEKDGLDLSGVFPDALPLVVDVGSGNGDFLYPYALNNPTMNVIGIEIQWKRVKKAAAKLYRYGVSNARLVCGDFRKILSNYVAPCSVTAFWFNFPDPWPKTKHHKYRLIDGVSARLLERTLKPGGTVFFVTDVEDLAAEAGLILNGCTRLVNGFAPAPYRNGLPGYVQSYYYRKWKAEGCRFYFLRYEKILAD